MLSEGTITCTKHSATITGSGTNFTMSNDDNIDLEGKYIKVIGNEVWYKILTVTDDTNIILDRSYRGETASGVYYELGDNQLFSTPDLTEEEEAGAGLF